MIGLVAALLLLLGPATGHSSARPSPTPLLTPDQLLSRRALRRARLLLQMRVLQLRDERLECIRAALLRELPGMLRLPEPAATKAPADDARVAGCGELLRF
jgi:hypothetical protein